MVIKVAEEAEVDMQEDSIHGMIEDMDIELVVEGGEDRVAAVAAVVGEEALAVHTDTHITANHRMDTFHLLLEKELSDGGVKSRSTTKRRDLEKVKSTGGYKCQRILNGDDRIETDGVVLDLDLELDREDRREEGEEEEAGYDDEDDEDEDEDGRMDYDVDGMSGSEDEDDGSSDYDEEDDGEIGDPEEGLESDEVDESEDQFIMQRFDWEEDQDPDRERKLVRTRAAAEAAAAAARAAEPFIPPPGWGGALAYQSATRREEDESSEDEFEEARKIVRETLVSKATSGDKDAGQIAESSRIDAATPTAAKKTVVSDRRTATTVTTMKAQSIDTHVSKKSKVVVDLTKEIQAKAVEQLEEPLAVNLTAMGESTVVTTDTVATVAEADAESEPDLQMLWVIDTEPSAIVLEEESLPQIQETYINLPPEPEFTRRPAKKSHRSKRGGKKLREVEQERKRIKAMNEAGDGHIALDEVESEVDDDMLALDDYLQNTTDPDNPDYFDSFLGSLTSLPSGFGHSSDVHGGLDADDSDFEEDASEDDSQDDEDFDFTAKSSERRRKRKADELLSGALDATFASDWPAGAPYGYDFYEPEEFVGRNGRRPRGGTAAAVPYGNHLEALTSINDHIKEFVNNRSKVSLELPPLAKTLRRRVHLLCEQYNLRSQSVGSGKNRFPVLLRTEKTKMPQTPIDLRKFMNAGFGPRVQAEFDNQRDRFNNSRRGAGGHNRRDGKRGGGPGNDTNKDPRDSARAVTGSVVGSAASEISKENVGHRMLAKMGWSPGVGLGALGDGITKPIEAVVRAKRRGLGHE
ncbi:squalene synthetase-like protein [Linnemannia schmuckeri]|uniref:Squalene synthetase-like protein n=1 Tax=Linnemannia schmuckeri TaxID=64567 RepID=A0A9P5RRK8_9FUNG|nr:squalene synthetase-like protein [Linnemannia schmuckeri]